jgi:hypothetical protein
MRFTTLSLALALAACTADGTEPDDPGTPSDPSDPNPNDPPGQGGDTCAEVAGCFDTCGDNDNACFDACFADGSSDAQQLINDITTCISSCQDDACVQRECGDLLEQCFDDTGGGGAVLPANLVGEWEHSEAQSNITYAFAANGTVHKIGGLATGSGSCDSSFVIEYDGIVSLSEDIMSIQVTDGSFTSFGCDGTTVTNSGTHDDPESFRFIVGIEEDGSDFLDLENVETGSIITYHRR